MSLMKDYATEVERDIERLSKMEVTDEEYAKAANAANSLMDRYIRLQDAENEYLKIDVEAKKAEIEEQKVQNEKRTQRLKIWTGVGLGVLYAGLQVFMVKDNQRYETGGGMHTTEPGRTGLRNIFGLFNKLG